MAANRIVVSEMGTMAYPDPSKNFIVKYAQPPAPLLLFFTPVIASSNYYFCDGVVVTLLFSRPSHINGDHHCVKMLEDPLPPFYTRVNSLHLLSFQGYYLPQPHRARLH